MKLSVKIDGTEIKCPTEYTIESYNVTKSERTASALMTMDFIAKKRKLILRYAVMSSAEKDLLFRLVDNPAKMFFEVTYREDNVDHKMTAYVGALKRNLHRTGAVWYWKDIDISLIER